MPRREWQTEVPLAKVSRKNGTDTTPAEFTGRKLSPRRRQLFVLAQQRCPVHRYRLPRVPDRVFARHVFQHGVQYLLSKYIPVGWEHHGDKCRKYFRFLISPSLTHYFEPALP